MTQEHTATDKCRKTATRIAPCPDYDMIGLESWLSDMAREGLTLAKDGVLLWFFTFEKTAPQQLQYRLQVREPRGFFDSDGRAPSPDAVALYQELGWQYVAQYRDFDIYCAPATTPRELNTDPTLQARTLQLLKKEQLSSVFCSVLQCIIFLCLSRYQVILFSLQAGSLFFALGAGLFLYLLLCQVTAAVHLGQLRKTLLQQGTLPHRKNWRNAHKRYRLRLGAGLVLTVLWFGWLFQLLAGGAGYTKRVSITKYPSEIPFATLSDLTPETDYTYTPNDLFDGDNTVSAWQDPLAPQSIDWQERAIIRKDGAEIVDGCYNATYHEMITPWLAKQLAMQYSRDMKNDFNEATPIALEMPVALDYFAAFDLRFGAGFVMQQGNQVLCVNFYNFNDYQLKNAPFTLEECAVQIADAMV